MYIVYFTSQIAKSSTSSLINNITSTLLGNRRSTMNGGAPSVTITPAGSIEALSRANTYQENTGNVSSDDESTPLVSELSSPSSGPTRTIGEFSNRAFGSPGSSEVSPSSVKSTPTHEHPSSAESSCRTLEGADVLHSFDVFGSRQDGEFKFSSHISHSFFRQDAMDSDDDERTPSRNDPETTV